MKPKPTAGLDQMPSCLQRGAVLSHLLPPSQSHKREAVQPGPASQGCVPTVSGPSFRSPRSLCYMSSWGPLPTLQGITVPPFQAWRKGQESEAWSPSICPTPSSPRSSPLSFLRPGK